MRRRRSTALLDHYKPSHEHGRRPITKIAKATKLSKEDFTSESFARLVSFAAFVKGLRL